MTAEEPVTVAAAEPAAVAVDEPAAEVVDEPVAEVAEEPVRGLRKKLQEAVRANMALQGRNAVLELRCATLMTDPRTASLPEELAAEAAALLGRIRAELAAAGVDDDAVRSVVGGPPLVRAEAGRRGAAEGRAPARRRPGRSRIAAAA